MRLAIDSNILFSAIIAPHGKTRDLLFTEGLELFAPDNIIEELNWHKKEILDKTGFNEIDLELITISALSRIVLVSLNELKSSVKEAEELCPDPDDMAFFALCLAKNLPLWSNDKKLKEQSVVKVLNTFELIKILNIID